MGGIKAARTSGARLTRHPSRSTSRLEDFVDRYLEAVVAHDPSRLPLAKRVKFTEMGQRLEIGDGFWHTASAVGRYRHYIADRERGQIGFIGTMREHGQLLMMALRLRVIAGRISEIESVFYRKGTGPAWNDSGMEALEAFAQVDPVWLEPIPRGERMTRAALATIANLYFVGLQGNDGKGLDGKGFYPFTADCLRIENAVRTTSNPTLIPNLPPGAFNYFALNCTEQFRSGYLAVVTRIHHRRFMAIDPALGAVFACAVFDHAGTTSVRLSSGEIVPIPAFSRPSSILLAEAFRIEKGLIRRIEAVGAGVPYHLDPGWAASAVKPRRPALRGPL